MKRFQNKRILVIGVSSGIGLATAQKLARDGATIVGVGRNNARIQSALSTLDGCGHHGIEADVSNERQLDSIIKFGKENGGFHGAVCCAGLHEMRPFSLLKSENFLTSFNANVLTAMNCTKVVIQAPSSDGASIVWMSSIAALRGTVGFTTYSAAKGALISASKAVAVELARKKIRVNVVTAGVVTTPMSQGWMQNLSVEQQEEIAQSHLLGLGKPSDVADAILFLLSDDSRWITGTTLTVDGGLSAR